MKYPNSRRAYKEVARLFEIMGYPCTEGNEGLTFKDTSFPWVVEVRTWNEAITDFLVRKWWFHALETGTRVRKLPLLLYRQPRQGWKATIAIRHLAVEFSCYPENLTVTIEWETFALALIATEEERKSNE